MKDFDCSQIILKYYDCNDQKIDYGIKKIRTVSIKYPCLKPNGLYNMLIGIITI